MIYTDTSRVFCDKADEMRELTHIIGFLPKDKHTAPDGTVYYDIYGYKRRQVLRRDHTLLTEDEFNRKLGL